MQEIEAEGQNTNITVFAIEIVPWQIKSRISLLTRN